ncbi:NAD(P)/FAD-dependent oxidoreductase [bacterium]|nr:NAD(P)/FAD-dependent oxidoreductase [bacterium]
MTDTIVIVGGGPAGITAAIQLKRLGRSVILVESGRLGGMLWEANLVENYPGFPKGIQGPRLARLMERHVKELGIEVIQHHVAKAGYSAGRFALKLSNGQTTLGTILVLATGTVPGTWEMPRISGDVDQMIHREITPLLSLDGKQIAVIGSGDAAFDYALNLSQNNTVQLGTRTEGEKSLQLLRDRVEESNSITWNKGAYLGKIERLEEKLRLTWMDTGGTWTTDVDALVAAVGRVANNRLYEGLSAELRERLLEEGKLHLIGDVVNGVERQTAIAVGDGMNVAMKIERQLTRERVE